MQYVQWQQKYKIHMRSIRRRNTAWIKYIKIHTLATAREKMKEKANPPTNINTLHMVIMRNDKKNYN
jgi:hypothetical protein